MSLKVYGDTLEEVINALIADDFLNEERFARSYARGKFRMKGWGKNKILSNLKQKQISQYCIKKAMTEIEDAAYLETLHSFLEKELGKLSSQGHNTYILRSKLFQKAYRKGFETNLINEYLERL